MHYSYDRTDEEGIKITKYLIENKIGLDSLDLSGKKPLDLICEYSKENIVKLIIDNTDGIINDNLIDILIRRKMFEIVKYVNNKNKKIKKLRKGSWFSF